MSSPQAKFVWYELMTTDAAAAEAYYRQVVGWGARDAGVPDVAYTLFTHDDGPVGGLMALPDEACAKGARPAWIGYVGVDDVDDYAGRFAERGGAVQRSPDDVPGIGRFAIVADPQGAVIALFQPNGEAPPGDAGGPCRPGHAGWHELMAADGEAAFGFYSGIFGWTRGEGFDMGPMGTYQLFEREGGAIGGMMTKPEAIPAPFWLYYFGVESIDAAGRRVTEGGGQILNGPMEVPGGQWIVQCRDPQGAMFALLGAKS